jgi:hypothetical protein
LFSVHMEDLIGHKTKKHCLSFRIQLKKTIL